jgi:DNA-directed RNA polymerase subunit beta
VELDEEDDELLRAAEELGLDLSGVRADGDSDGKGAADEREEQVVAEGEGGSTDGKGTEEAAVEE